MNSTPEPLGSPPAGPGERPGSRLWPYAVVLLVAVALFAPFFFQGRIFLAADTLRVHLPWSSTTPPGFRPHNTLITDPVNSTNTALYSAQLRGGGLAHWNAAIFTGVPATGVTALAGGPGRLSPLKLLLHRFFSAPTATMLLNFLYFCLMGGTMYAFLLAVGAGRCGALFGATAYMLNGSLMVWLEFESQAATAALVPLVLLLLERFAGPRRLAAACAGGLVLGGVCLMGMLQYVIYVWLLLGAYLLFVAARTWRADGWRRALAVLGCFGLTAAIAALIAALEFLPAQELIAGSSRIVRSFTFGEFFARLGSIPGRWWVTLVFPDFFGSPPLGFNLMPGSGEYVNYNELCLYLGVPTLFALLGALVAGRRPHGLLFFGIAVASAAMAAGTVLYWPLFRFVPGMDRMNPLRLIFIFSLAAPAAAAFGVRAVEEAGDRQARIFAWCCAAAAAAVLIFALLADDPGLARWFNPGFFATARSESEAVLGFLASLRSLSSPAIGLPLATALAAAGLFAAFARSRRLRPAAFALLVALLVVDLVSFGRRYNTLASPAEIFPETPSIRFLKSQPGPFRVLTDGRGFMPNTLAPFGLEEIGGYSSFYPERVGRLMSYAEFGPRSREGMRFDRWITFRNLGSPLFNLMNARYVVVGPAARLSDTQRFREVFRGDTRVYENRDALPRAWVVPQASVLRDVDAILARLDSPGFNPREEVVLEEDPDPAFLADPGRAALAAGAVIRRYEPGRVELEATLPARGWLVLADTYFPGWEATVDGRSVPILRANCNFRALPLRAGTHPVVFTYRPRPLARGLVLASLGAVLGLGGLVLAAVRGRRGRAAEGRDPGAGGDAPVAGGGPEREPQRREGHGKRNRSARQVPEDQA